MSVCYIYENNIQDVKYDGYCIKIKKVKVIIREGNDDKKQKCWKAGWDMFAVYLALISQVLP